MLFLHQKVTTVSKGAYKNDKKIHKQKVLRRTENPSLFK